MSIEFYLKKMIEICGKETVNVNIIYTSLYVLFGFYHSAVHIQDMPVLSQPHKDII